MIENLKIKDNYEGGEDTFVEDTSWNMVKYNNYLADSQDSTVS